MTSVSLIKLLLGIYRKSYLIKESLSIIYPLQSRGNGKRKYDYFFPLFPLLFGGGVFVV